MRHSFIKFMTAKLTATVEAENMEAAQNMILDPGKWTAEGYTERILEIESKGEETLVFEQEAARLDGDPDALKAWKEFYPYLTQPESEFSGGIHTPACNRLLLMGLSLSAGCYDILELGFDAGYTTMALALTGANITAVDNNTEHPMAVISAKARLSGYENVNLVMAEALFYLKECKPLSFDLIFMDDNHEREHVAAECREIDRILRHGGLVVIHDTIVHNLWYVAGQNLPHSYERIEFPSYQKDGEDYGIGVFRKPY